VGQKSKSSVDMHMSMDALMWGGKEKGHLPPPPGRLCEMI